jgi:hypothetical protein
MRTRHVAFAFLVAAAVTACSAARYVIDPPQVDLTQMGSLGLVTLKAEGAKGDLDASATQLFLQEINAAQRVPVVELGPQATVLADLGKTAFDRDAVVALGEKQGLDAFFTGEIVVTKVKPQLDLAAPIQKTLLARTAFDVAVKVRLISARNGATLWTRSAAGQATVGTVGIDGGVPVFAVQDKSAAMHDLLRDLMYRLTWDFRPTRRRL